MDDPTLSEIAARYADSVKDSSRQGVIAELNRFVKWCGERPLSKLTGHDIALYSEDLGPATPDTSKRADHVRCFLVYLKKQGMLPRSLAPHLRLRKSAKGAAATPGQSQAAIELTQDGIDSLTAELLTLKEQRLIVREEIKHAMLDKDFRENSPLDAAKDKQGHLEARVRQIEATLKYAVVVDARGHRGRVRVGATVTVRSLENGATKQFHIVGPTEANAADGKISSVSPVGMALLNRRVGDEVEVKAPAGVRRFKIEEIAV